VKASKTSIHRAVDQPDRGLRFYLFHGQDDAQARALGRRLVEGLGATKFLITSGAIKSDSALLADEAGAMSLFGDSRAIWIEPATKDIEDGVRALLDGPAPESPVIAIGAGFTKNSPLVKLAESSPHALAFAAYLPEGHDAERMVVDIGRRYGLKIAAPLAARIGESCGNDQAIVAQELQKLALYADASPQAPKELDREAVEAVGAEPAEGDFLRLADLALTGEMAALSNELARLSPAGTEAVSVVRSLQRRLLMLAQARARAERGESVDGAMTSTGKSLYFKDKKAMDRMVPKWSAERLATISERIGTLERNLVFSPAPEREALGEELLTIARAARAR
jgi:DNA polymerase-3 subunit delta